jgi:pimeloyl-ACP methyl ester carboxylesterase
MPTLVIWGAQDRFVPVSYAEKFGSGLPNAEVRIIPGAAHYPHIERQDEVVAAVNDFLR